LWKLTRKMEGVLLKAFCDIKNGIQPQGLSASDMNKINAFLNWKIYIGEGELGIIDQNNDKLAYLKVNTNTLNLNHDYIIVIKRGEPYLVIQSHVNLPQRIKLNKKQVLSIQNTPDPALWVNQYNVNYTHQTFKAQMVD